MDSADVLSAWSSSTDSAPLRHLVDESQRTLEAYRVKPSLVREHANIERATAQGGYGHRQLYELVQNGADALIEQPGGRIRVVLTSTALYCANEGAAIDAEGVEAILSSHVSMKRGTEIGRFGLGFKSVLGVTRTPQFFSRSAAFGFDAASSARAIREIVPDAQHTPVLRIAGPIDPMSAADQDITLRELMSWATTVVRLPRDLGDSSWLSDDVAAFPAAFLLFSPHVGALELVDVEAGASRIIRVEQRHDTLALVDNDDASTWKVFSTVHRPSEVARSDAGELSGRDQLPLIWAVPTQGVRRRGSYWAFFPTEYESSLSGILNAPWKTNEDRQNLLQGTFNNELLDAVADLVINSLPSLLDEADPGRLLDVLPGRIDESPHWADRRLNQRIFELGQNAAILPDSSGVLRDPRTLQLHPALVNDAALAEWASAPQPVSGWCHHSIHSRERRARAERLFGKRSWAVADSRDWLEALVLIEEDDWEVDGENHVDPGNSATAIRAFGAARPDLVGKDFTFQHAAIVLTDDGRLVPPNPESVFFRSAYTVDSPVAYVHPDVAADEGAARVLRELGIDVVDAIAELETLARRHFAQADWDHVWQLTRAADQNDVIRALTGHPTYANELHVCTAAGSVAPLIRCLLPGRVLLADPSDTMDDKARIDDEYHTSDIGLLRKLGAGDTPTPSGGRKTEPWFAKYRAASNKLYEAALQGHPSRPQHGYIVFEESDFPGPIAPLERLSPRARAEFTQLLLAAPGALAPWHLSHKSRRDAYPVVAVPSPTQWSVLEWGELNTSVGLQPLRACVGKNLHEVALALPVVDLPTATVSAFGLPNRFDELTEEHWANFFTRLTRTDVEDGDRVRLYAVAARHGQTPPDELTCRLGAELAAVPTSSVAVVVDAHEAAALIDLGVPHFLCLAHDAEALRTAWGMTGGKGVVHTELRVTSPLDPVEIVDAFPVLREYGLEGLLLVRCDAVRLETSTERGTRSEDVTHAVRDGHFYWPSDSGDDRALLSTLDRALGLGLTDTEISDQLRDSSLAARSALIERLGGAQNDAERLSRIAGVPALRRRLPENLMANVREIFGEPSDDEVAELCLAVHGLDSVKELAPELEQAGLQPPRRWAGSDAAVSFVAELGFGREFAGFEGARRPALVEVDGPVILHDLHSFQRRVSESMRKTVLERGRGLLSLPTGAGKTRVAVQTLVELLADSSIGSPILWVAQTDELCEQAVQTWAEVWRALGPRRTLSVSRLWASNGAEPVEGDQVVVATISKLSNCLGKPRFDWLARASAIVIDEAHSSTATSYTALLNWLDLGRGKTGSPLVGLTGTPFRGRSESGADQLAARYARHRLDAGAFDTDPHRELQDMGVLARVRHRILGGAELDLSEAELNFLRTMNRLPSAVEERLGADVERNRALIDSIAELPGDWPVLVFTASVTHAQTLAALLTVLGIPARAISANTEPAARRYYVEEFRRGGIRVLTNYGVLTEGFDAPATRAVYVARPTYSPNRYQQMIGRGLRGPLNGGKDECLIVDVADNVLQYGGSLAFRDFEYLWDS